MAAAGSSGRRSAVQVRVPDRALRRVLAAALLLAVSATACSAAGGGPGAGGAGDAAGSPVAPTSDPPSATPTGAGPRTATPLETGVPAPQQPPADARISAVLARMSLADKVGQLFVTYVYGDSATTARPEYTSRN